MTDDTIFSQRPQMSAWDLGYIAGKSGSESKWANPFVGFEGEQWARGWEAGHNARARGWDF